MRPNPSFVFGTLLRLLTLLHDMEMKLTLFCRWIILALSILASAAAQPTMAFSQVPATGDMTSLEAQINAIRTATDPATSGARFVELYQSVQQNPNRLNDADIDFLAKLLSDDDDFIRGVAAGTLGDIGPRARRTAPQLAQALGEIVCVPGSLTSEGPIRVAFKKIEVDPPDVPCRNSGPKPPPRGPPFID